MINITKKRSFSVLVMVMFLLLVSKKNCFSGEWYEGGTLHQSNAIEWQNAAYSNRLATAADFTYRLLGNKPEPVMKSNSKDLVACMDKSVEGETGNMNFKMSEIAAMCAVFMGWELKK